jgi:hypothetical protein
MAIEYVNNINDNVVGPIVSQQMRSSSEAVQQRCIVKEISKRLLVKPGCLAMLHVLQPLPDTQTASKVCTTRFNRTIESSGMQRRKGRTILHLLLETIGRGR